MILGPKRKGNWMLHLQTDGTRVLRLQLEVVARVHFGVN